MGTTPRLKLRDGDRLIDAEFTVTVTSPRAFEITLESSGGSTSRGTARNSEYSLALSEILRRTASIASSLDDCLVVSRVARSLPENERRVVPTSPFAYPIMLGASDDYQQLRLALTAPQVRIASKAKSGGNMRKNIVMRFTSRVPNLTTDVIQSALDASATDSEKLETRDLATSITNREVDAARNEWHTIGERLFNQKYGTNHTSNLVIVDPDGTEYDAGSILFAAQKFAGLNDLVPLESRDKESVEELFKRLGYIVEDVSTSSTANPLALQDAYRRSVHQTQEFEGDTDSTAERKVRREQQLLRRALGLGKGSHECSLCGRTYPDQLLVAAHIKRRSDCTYEEKVDIPAVAMIACALGCDALFEQGFVTVNDNGVVEVTELSTKETDLVEILQALHGRRVSNFNPQSAPYFDWHRKSVIHSGD